MKKRIGLYSSGLVLFLMAVVSAKGGDLSEGLIGMFVKLLNGITGPLLAPILGSTPGGEWVFTKFLFMMIILAISWSVLKKIPLISDSSWVLWTVSLGVSILSTRWIQRINVLQAILLPYSTIGIAISAGIPFIVWFFVIESISIKTVRRIGWIFFAVIFIGLWATRSEDIGNLGYIYFFTAIGAFVMMLLDGSFQRWKKKIAIERKLSPNDAWQIMKLQEKLEKINEIFNKDPNNYMSIYWTAAGKTGRKAKGGAGYKFDQEYLLNWIESIENKASSP